MASTDAMMNLMNLAFVIVRPNLEKSRPYGKISPPSCHPGLDKLVIPGLTGDLSSSGSSPYGQRGDRRGSRGAGTGPVSGL